MEPGERRELPCYQCQGEGHIQGIQCAMCSGKGKIMATYIGIGEGESIPSMSEIMSALDKMQDEDAVAPDDDPLILDEIRDTVLGERAKMYGSPEVNFDRIAKGWSAYLGVDISMHDVTHMMNILKSMRAREGYHHDSTADGVGYLVLDQILSEPGKLEWFKREILGKTDA